MKATRLAIPDIVRLEPEIFEDARGLFFESFNQRAFEAATGIAARFVQDNHSVSHKGVLRGLHYQLAPHVQGKLVRVLRGAAYDVAVDIREGSPSYGKWVAETLTAENRLQLWIPEGFAHGFLALEDGMEFQYKTTEFWHPESERTIPWDDPEIGVEWPGEGALVTSSKDAAANRY
ncbi:MAG: dTDP-4-dehydrorhamnose 3,5-epimerase [Devosia sp.]